MTRAQLEELKKLCAGATPGPWGSESYGGAIGDVSEIYAIATGDNGDCENAMTKETANFIAASRTAVPELIAEVERLRGIVAMSEYCGKRGPRIEPAACPWCVGEFRFSDGKSSAVMHANDCPAFTPEGEVK